MASIGVASQARAFLIEIAVRSLCSCFATTSCLVECSRAWSTGSWFGAGPSPNCWSCGALTFGCSLVLLRRRRLLSASATLASPSAAAPVTLGCPSFGSGAHRPCSLCFCALCPEAAKINTAAPNLIQQQNKTIGAVNQNDESSTYQTTRGNNRPSAPCALPHPWVSPGLFPPWPPPPVFAPHVLLGPSPRPPLGLPWPLLGVIWAFLGLSASGFCFLGPGDPCARLRQTPILQLNNRYGS